MDIFKEFNKKVDQLTDKLSRLAQKNLLSTYDIEIYNNTLKNITQIQDFFSAGINLDLNLSEAALEAWKDYETNRSVFFAKPYTPISRRIAVKKIFELVKGVEEDFINVVEWATALNYKEITPNILNIIKKKEVKKENNGEVFKNSVFSNYNKFLYFFINHKMFNDIDFKAYYTRILTWSESRGKESKHWGYTALLFLDKDIKEKKVIMLTPDQRKVETLTDKIKLKKLWSNAIINLDPILQTAEPFKLFRFFMHLKADSTTKRAIENNIDKIIEKLPNTKFLIIK